MLQLPARYTPALSEEFESDGDLLIQICETFMATKEDGDKPIVFDEWQKGIARGQFAAWYDGEELIGSGVIS